MKKVTVIIPYRNEVAYLKDCVQSVPREVADVLIVPDCQGEPVPEEIADLDHVTVMPVPEGTEQKGVAWCRNQGMKAAVTEYVYFLDCDDYVIGGSLEKMLSCAEEMNASLVTGNITKSWYSPINFEANEKMWESEIVNTCPLGNVVKERFATMFSANHLLLRKKVIEEKQISFSETTVRYSDFSFVVALLRETMDEAFVVGEATYVSRLRNDMIHLPALSQQENGESGKEFLACYDDAMKEAEGNGDLVELLHKHLVDYVVTRFPKIVTFSVVPEYRKRLASIANAKAYVAKENVFRRMQLRCIRNGHYKLAKRMTQANTLWTKKEGRFGSKIQWYRILEHFIFKKMPIKKNWILFESFFGKSYSDSPKYLYEYLQKNYGDKYRYIWILNGKSQSLEKTGRH
ncbi:MAG: glycosyltransferase, partial [Eubacterium sp.]|nr:glycosyltransferase [Eubacterium sp.]